MKGFVLAGGASTRFGSEKALHPVDGVAMALRVVRALEGAGLDVQLVVRNRDLAELGPSLLHEPPSPGHHPLQGVHAALQSLEPGECGFFAPCDMPWLRSDGVRALLAARAPAVASDGKRIHPLLCQVPWEWRARVEEALRQGGAVRELFSGVTQVVLEPAQLANINRVEDLKSVPPI
ncbi:MAG: NTP transferase domain-containing protein [Myxococcota bacterium]|nr:NTP transferase domain-containing protein [Myxococcota bacterium]